MTAQNFNRVPTDRPRLDSVPEVYRDTVNDLFDTWAGVRGRNRAIRNYYEMKNEMKSLGISIPPQCDHVNSVVGWCSKAIAAHANRSKFDGFVSSDGTKTPELDALVRTNRLRSLYQQAVKSALTYGVAFFTVMRRGSGIKVRVFSANQACALWDKDEDRIRAGIVLSDIDRTNRPCEYVVHTDDAVLTLTRMEPSTAHPTTQADYRWTCTVEPHILGRPMMEVLVHDPDPDRPLGHSMITPELMGIVDKAMRDVLRMEVGAEFFTAPQRYILGATEDLFSVPTEDADEDGNTVNVPSTQAKWRAYLGSFLALTRDENGEVPQVGQFAAGSAGNFTAVFENDAQRFSGATNVPLAQLGVLSNTYTSSDALSATDNPLILEVEVMNDRNREVMEELARMMLAIQGGVSLVELDESQQSVQACFTDPSMPTIAARADSWTKLGGNDESIIGTDVYYEGVGLDKPTRTRLDAEKNTMSVNKTMADLAAAITAGAVKNQGLEPVDGTTEPV